MPSTNQVKPAALQPWWHKMSLATDQCWFFSIGPLQLYLRRLSNEWQCCFEQQKETEDRYLMLSNSTQCLPPDLSTQRFIFKKSPEQFSLTPVLLDRPVVIKTRQPVSIPPGEQALFYISSPVCVKLSLHQPDCVLQEIPTQRLSDTWFGPSTQQGELCYAAKTHARHSRAEVPLRPHRAVTPVTIENKSDQLLTINKLSIPVPFLAVYGLADGTLWTDPISLQHDGNHALTRFKISKQAPEGCTAADLLSQPRLQVEKHGLIRAFTDIFSD